MRRLPGPGLLVTVAVAAGLLVAACGGGGPPVATPTPAGGEASTAAPSPTPTAVPFGGRGPVEGGGTAPIPPGALLVDVRTGLHQGFDRIVFEFRGGIPDYRVEYVSPLILADGSGRPVEIEGAAFLRARFTGAAAHDPETGQPTYTRPDEIAVGQPSLREAEQTGDFEGVLTWVLGLAQEVDFRVITLEGPYRVVIDIAHP